MVGSRCCRNRIQPDEVKASKDGITLHRLCATNTKPSIEPLRIEWARLRNYCATRPTVSFLRVDRPTAPTTFSASPLFLQLFKLALHLSQKSTGRLPLCPREQTFSRRPMTIILTPRADKRLMACDASIFTVIFLSHALSPPVTCWPPAPHPAQFTRVRLPGYHKRSLSSSISLVCGRVRVAAQLRQNTTPPFVTAHHS